MLEAKRPIDGPHFRLLRHVQPYSERVKPSELLKSDVLRYEALSVLLHLIPGLWDRLRKSKPQWLRLFHMPYLVLVDTVIEERGKELIVRPKSQMERNEALMKLLLSHVLDEGASPEVQPKNPNRDFDSGSGPVLGGEVKLEVQGILRRKLESEGLIVEGEESSLILLLDEVFFGGMCYPEEMCVRVDSGESTSEDEALEFREGWHVRV